MMNKKTITVSLFSLLLAGCNFPSSNNTSLSSTSFVTSSSSPSILSSTSSSENSSTSITSSTNGTSQTSSSPSSEPSEEPTDKKVAFEDIDTLVAQVADAKALGILPATEEGNQTNDRKRSQSEETPQNYVVKVTETYDPQTEVIDNETLKVSFLRTTSTITNELQTGSESYLATAEPIEIVKTLDVPGHVIVNNVPGYQFRALQDNVILSDWKADVGASTEFLFDGVQTFTSNVVATAAPITVQILSDVVDGATRTIEVQNAPGYEFRIVSDATVIADWKRADSDLSNVVFEIDAAFTTYTLEARSFLASITFDASVGVSYDLLLGTTLLIEDVTQGSNLDEDDDAETITIAGLTEGLSYTVKYEARVIDTTLTNIEIQARSIDASISFTAFAGFTYSVKLGDTSLYTELVDNDQIDLNPKEGVISVKGLIENQAYDVHYEGYELVERISQDEIDGQVDKLFVLYQYTFISFIPLNQTLRPLEAQLVRDYDGVPVYDKTNYFSNATRQSFVIDNDSGYIYKIENLTITNLSGGCVSIQGNPSPFDMKTNPDGSLSFVSLSNNASVVVNGCIKDKHGYTYVNNNLINTYESSTKTYFYVPNSFYSTYYDVPYNNAPSTGQRYTYWLNSLGEVVRTEPTGLTNGGLIYRVMTGEAVNATRPLNALDQFELYVSQYKYRPNNTAITIANSAMQHMVPKTRVEAGTVYTNFGPNVSGKANPMMFYQGYESYSQFNYLVETVAGVTTYYSSYVNPNFAQAQTLQYATMIDYLDQYGIVIVYRNGKVSYYADYWTHHRASFANTNAANISTYSATIDQVGTVYGKHTNAYRGPAIELTELAGTTINNQGKLQKVTASSTITYDLVIETVDQQWVVTPYVTGTYQAATPTTITFQPINK